MLNQLTVKKSIDILGGVFFFKNKIYYIKCSDKNVWKKLQQKCIRVLGMHINMFLQIKMSFNLIENTFSNNLTHLTT